MMDRKAILHRSLACLLVALTLFLLISLVSYSAWDTGRMSAPVAAKPSNWCGLAGARLADVFVDWLGFASYLAVGLLAAWGAFWLIRKQIDELWLKVIGGFLLLSAAAAALGMIRGMPPYAPSWGGKFGAFYAMLLDNYCSVGGAILVISLTTVFGLIFLGVDTYAAAPVASGFRKFRNRVAVLLRRRREDAPAAAASLNGGALPYHVHATFGPAEGQAAVVEPEVQVIEDKPEGTTLPADFAAGDAPAAVADAGAGTAAQPAAGDTAPPQGGDTRRSVEERLSESIKRATQPPKMPRIPESRQPEGDYELPSLELLDDPEYHESPDTQAAIENNIAILETTLADFNIGAEVVDIDRGPVITRYELSLAPGIKVTRITSLADDIAMAVKAPSVRIVAPIPGKSTVGIEIPNAAREVVRLKELAASKEFKHGKFQIPVMLGKDTSGTPIIYDLAKMPHLLIAGATGSGKSVCINSILLSMLMTKRPDDLKLILIDPKMVELSIYEEVPHLLCPVVTDMRRAPWILEWATKQMDERYDMLSAVGVRHITQFNTLGEEVIRRRLGPDGDYDKMPFHLPYMVIIIDELADLMISSAKEVENSITRLAQKSRAVGIHIILATQRPSVDVITGLIKANMPTRISFHVTSKVDSRTILDGNGAEKLLGSGDLLFMPPDVAGLVRIQGTYVSDQEIKRVVNAVQQETEGPGYKLDLDNWGGLNDDDEGEFDDELYDQAIRIVLETQRGSVSLLQRKLEIGYTRASRLMDHMATEGIVGSYKGSKAREVIMALDEWEKQHGGGRPEGYGPASRVDLQPEEIMEKVEEQGETEEEE